jgi:ribonuclease HI
MERFFARLNLAAEDPSDSPPPSRFTISFESSTPISSLSPSAQIFHHAPIAQQQAPALEKKPWYLLQFDGGANPNPGPASSGAVLFRCTSVVDKQPVVERGIFHPRATNNIAEWRGLILGLEMALQRGVRRLEVEGDSQLVVRQMRGEYRVHDRDLKPLYTRAKELSARFTEGFHIRHVYREHNIHADRITKEMLSRRAPYERIYSGTAAAAAAN